MYVNTYLLTKGFNIDYFSDVKVSIRRIPAFVQKKLERISLTGGELFTS